jgi:hypothetical protein
MQQATHGAWPVVAWEKIFPVSGQTIALLEWIGLIASILAVLVLLASIIGEARRRRRGKQQ